MGAVHVRAQRAVAQNTRSRHARTLEGILLRARGG
jgi:hypothetical protein